MKKWREGIDELDKVALHLKNALSAFVRYENNCSHPDDAWKELLLRLNASVARKREDACFSAQEQEDALYGPGLLRPVFCRGDEMVRMCVHRPCEKRPAPHITEVGLKALLVFFGGSVDGVRVNAAYDVEVYDRGVMAMTIPGTYYSG